jgi:flagellin
MSVINTNIKALAAQGSMSNVNKSMETTMERLSTGLRINSAKDDAAGLAITNRMTSQIRGYAVAIRNSNDGISMAQTAEGAMGQVTNMLQRMRELSVQAANGAMSNADRSNIQLEVSQLKLQIDDVANKTNHNNIKLLDGSAGKIVLQTGTNSNDTMSISFDSVKTKDIGLGSRASLAALGTSFATVTGAAAGGEDMAAGDLLLNGVAVGASLAIDDKLSYEGNDSSAIAKAAAINRVSAQSGVFATVGQTTVHGSVMTAAVDSGTITINGVETATVYTTTDAELSRAAVVTAINDISDQTGVRAINTNDDSKGVVLVAADGRNITVESTDLDELVSGLATLGNTYTGTYELNTLDGRSITVGSNVDGDLTTSGLNFGTFEANTAQSVTTARTVASTAAPAELNGNTLVINGVGIDAAVSNDDNASYDDTTGAPQSFKADSAIAIAAAINKKTSLTGVTATAQANIISGNDFTAATVTTFVINGVETIGTGAAFNSRDDLLTAVNQVQGQTGVIAEANGDGIRLIAQDGRNITINTDAAALSDLGLTGADSSIVGSDTDPATFYSTVKLSSDKAFTVDSGSEGNDTNFELLGFHKGTFGGADNALKVKDIDVSTITGATVALEAIDAALDSVAVNQARSGAYQNRLDAVVSNLTESNQNMSASRSRILDTDYATETTNLARSQIISQAATAMLAQANQSSQTVLSLLK